MNNHHTVLIIPGLGDYKRPLIPLLTAFTSSWVSFGLHPQVHVMGWQDGGAFQPKLELLLSVIDSCLENNQKVSLIGLSAGGSAVMNAFLERKDSISHVVNVCGRIRTGPTNGLRSFYLKTAFSPAFAESIKQCEAKEGLLPAKYRSKILTIRSSIGDELVPGHTITIPDATNKSIPVPEHMLCIGAALTLFSGTIIHFLNQ